MALEFEYAIVQPYTDRPDRLEATTVVSRHWTASEALAELDRMTMKLHRFNITERAIEMLVVDSKRRPVTRGTEETSSPKRRFVERVPKTPLKGMSRSRPSRQECRSATPTDNTHSLWFDYRDVGQAFNTACLAPVSHRQTDR